MYLGIFGSKLNIKSDECNILKSYGFDISHFKVDNDEITEIYFDIGPWNQFIDILDETKSTYLIDELIPLLKKKNLIFRFINEEEIKELPVYRIFPDDSLKLEVIFILESGQKYKQKDFLKYNLEIKNISKDKPIKFTVSKSALISLRIEDIAKNEIAFWGGDELDKPEEIVIEPNSSIKESNEIDIELSTGSYILRPETCYFKFDKVESFYTLTPIKIYFY
ncbi:MAG: hypothetical protein ACTSRP_15545 [Candidatus Helarchaeota archaeon]